jgi:hypothetical protein
VFKSVLKNLFGGGSQARNGRRRRCFARRLCVEHLEDRRVLANFTVTNLADAVVSGPGSAPGTLRQAIYDANNSHGDDVIKFDAGVAGFVDLTVIGDTAFGPTALLVNSTITIRGNAGGVTISRDVAAPEMRLFRVTAGGNLTLESISLTGGVARGVTSATPGEDGGDASGGAIFNQGAVSIIASTLYNNQALGGNAGAGGRGGAGLGGAIHSDAASLTLTNATLSGNSASSGTGATVPSSFGGGVYSKNGLLNVYNSTIANSTASTGKGAYVKAIDGTATIDIQSSIIGQSSVSVVDREFVTVSDDLETGLFVVTGGNNLIRSQLDFHSIAVSTEDPLLGPLTSNGGPAMTHAVPASSPAINLGNNSQSLDTDQRGTSFARVVGGVADIGAFELQSSIGPALPGDYNGNHVVDGADYVVWRKTFGANVPQYSGADGNGNMIVDAQDYDVWRAHFGMTGAAAMSSPAVAAVVESALVKAVQTTEAEVLATSSELSIPVISGVKSARSHGVVDRGSNSDYWRRSLTLAIVELARNDVRRSVNGAEPHSHSQSSPADSNHERGCSERVADAVWADWPKIARFGT